MNSSRAKKDIISRIRKDREEKANLSINNTANSSKVPDNIYSNIKGKSIREIFTRQINEVGGSCIIVKDNTDLQNKLTSLIRTKKWKNIFCIDKSLIKLFKDSKILFTDSDKDFINMEAGLTSCEFLVARFGSILVSSKQTSGRRMNIFPPVHMVIANISQLVMEPGEALEKLQNKYVKDFPSMISLITGPSRTADIEKTLVMGAHGPKELYVFLLDNKPN